MPRNYTVQTLKDELELIGHVWHLGTHQGNDGNHGNTLETLLGVPENNLQLPDYGSIELKCQISEKKNLLTLFHKEPLPPASLPKLIRTFGWKHQKAGTKYPSTEMSFRSTTSSDGYTSRGFRILLSNHKIQFAFNKNQVKRNDVDRSKAYPNLGAWADDIETRVPHYSTVLPVYWKELDFIKSCSDKLEDTLYCFCEKKTENDLDYFMFVEAYIFRGFLSEKISHLFEQGGLFIDIDARSGHNHGVKLRIKPNLLTNLFSTSEKVL